MYLLKKENWWIWLILFIFTGGSSTIVLGALLSVFDKNSWYAKWYIWLIGLLLIIPFYIMSVVLLIQITSLASAKLNIKGKEFYLSPYIWIILLIIPIIGWILFIVLLIYINISILVKLYNGEGEKYIE